MSTLPEKIVLTLVCSDGETFELEKAVAVQSKTIENLLEDIPSEGNIPVPNVSGSILAKVIEYLKQHSEDNKEEDEGRLRAWDTEFVKVDQKTLIDLMLAADYLNIKGLLNLACQAVADMIQGRNPDEIRRLFNIKSDLTPEEEEEMRREYRWAFE
ncbi:hypothetical protein L6164_028995 [Bauhinia variegata]|uniref:Uncharacterized protein n=1 Tax=Bauhinia variegata TaxID=167791 RepID=A0ACB9L8A5_BAUVA|nr:hypothetical protein L6164_028995 [Bauhinia variegata]